MAGKFVAMENYPRGNKELIAELGLIKHPEGGYFVETDRQLEKVASPFASTFCLCISSPARAR